MAVLQEFQCRHHDERAPIQIEGQHWRAFLASERAVNFWLWQFPLFVCELRQQTTRAVATSGMCGANAGHCDEDPVLQNIFGPFLRAPSIEPQHMRHRTIPREGPACLPRPFGICDTEM